MLRNNLFAEGNEFCVVSQLTVAATELSTTEVQSETWYYGTLLTIVTSPPMKILQGRSHISELCVVGEWI